MEPSQLGARLQHAREAKGWHQRDLARASHVNASIINRIETGALVNPTLDTLHKLAKALAIDFGYLAIGDERKEDSPSERMPTGTGCRNACPVPAV
jgi:transcriptional regulator with XRE-family HTH domain